MQLPLDTDVLAARTGDRDAFARLVSRYRGLVASISLSTVGNVSASEDVAQEVFLAAWRDLSTLRNASSFLPWLRQLTRHRALDAARGGRRRPTLDEAAIEAAADPSLNAQDVLLANERARAVAIALDALPDDAREVITLYYREGRSIEQVARLLGLREDTAKKRLSLARAALRDEVLASFADAVESTAPGDDFTRNVMVGLPMFSPAVAAVAGKGLLHVLAQWMTAAVSAGAMIGIMSGGLPILSGIRKEMRGAIDARERQDLRRIAVVAIGNLAAFCVGVQVVAGWWLIAYGVVFAAIHMSVYLVWLPRAKVRRRRAEVLRDPAAAGRHARQDACTQRTAWVACAVVLTAAGVAAAHQLGIVNLRF